MKSRPVASSWERSGERERAAEEYLEVWTHYPWSESARVADEALGSLRDPLEEPLRSARQYSERGDAFFDKRSNEEALEAYDRALALGGLKSNERRRVARQRADTLFRLRRYPEAAAAYAGLPQDDRVQIEKARSHARSGDVPRAIRELESIGAKAGGAHASRANLLAGLLAEGEGDDGPERAEAYFEKALGGRSRTIAAVAGWRLGWSRYRAERFAEAIEPWIKTAQTVPRTSTGRSPPSTRSPITAFDRPLGSPPERCQIPSRSIRALRRSRNAI